MTDEIMQLMDTRRSYKNKDPDKQRHIHRTIRGKINEAKEKWLGERCKEIEELEKKYYYHNMYKQINNMTTQRNKASQYTRSQSFMMNVQKFT